jgi:hypothetical protein
VPLFFCSDRSSRRSCTGLTGRTVHAPSPCRIHMVHEVRRRLSILPRSTTLSGPRRDHSESLLFARSLFVAVFFTMCPHAVRGRRQSWPTCDFVTTVYWIYDHDPSGASRSFSKPWPCCTCILKLCSKRQSEKKEWLDSRISSKPLMYCIVKIESIFGFFYSSPPSPVQTTYRSCKLVTDRSYNEPRGSKILCLLKL